MRMATYPPPADAHVHGQSPLLGRGHAACGYTGMHGIDTHASCQKLPQQTPAAAVGVLTIQMPAARSTGACAAAVSVLASAAAAAASAAGCCCCCCRRAWSFHCLKFLLHGGDHCRCHGAVPEDVARVHLGGLAISRCPVPVLLSFCPLRAGHLLAASRS